MASTTYAKGQSVTNVDCKVRYRIERVHRDGTYTVRALFNLDADGADRPGYLGYVYLNIPPRYLLPFVEQEAS